MKCSNTYYLFNVNSFNLILALYGTDKISSLQRIGSQVFMLSLTGYYHYAAIQRPPHLSTLKEGHNLPPPHIGACAPEDKCYILQW